MRGSRLANLLVATAAGVIFLAGLLIPGVAGALLLVAVAVLLVVLSSAAWSSIPVRGRRVRIVIVGVVLLIAVIKLGTK